MTKQILLILFFINATNLHGQWIIQDVTISQSLNGINMRPEGEGWVVGNNGVVYHLSNNGYQWQVESGLPVTENFNDVCFVSPTEGWCVGTVDGNSIGKAYRRNALGTWEPLNPPSGMPELLALSCVKGTNQNNHFLCAVGFSKTILVSTNSGNVLNSPLVPPPTGSALRDVYFIDSNKGWAVGNIGVITRTTNGGSSWSDTLSTPSNSWLYGVYFFDENLGWVVGNAGTIWKTIDGGDSWIDQNPGQSLTSERLHAIIGIDAFHLVTVGQNGTILLTSDGGDTWIAENGLSGDFNDVAMIDVENYWIIGDNGVNYYSEGTINISSESIQPGSRFETGDLLDISFQTTFNSFVDLEYSLDNGNNWNTISNNVPANPGNFIWTIPSTPSSNCLLRIRSSQKSQVQAISPSFEIFEKTLNLLTPSEGANLIGGELYTIEWTHTNVELINLQFREAPNATAHLIEDNIQASDLQFEWKVAEVNCDQCQIILSELDGSPIASSGFFSIEFDDAKPEIELNPVTISPVKGEDLLVEVKITDDNATSNKLFFRQGGDITFSESTSLTSVGNNLYQTTIPASTGVFRIDERGLEFYIKSVDSSPGSNTCISDTIYRPVSLSSSDFSILRSGPGSDEIYQMISIHYDLNEKNINTVLGEDLGPYDGTQWRLWQWQTDEKQYGELNTNNIGTLSRGKSFWIASVKENFMLGAGQSYSTDDYMLELQPGWNQIGHPFAFPVNYCDIIDANTGMGILSQFYDYKDNNYVPVEDMLEPRKGYFIKNMNSKKVTYKIPAIAADRGPSSCRIMKATSEGWKIQLQVRNNQASDAYNYVGMQKSASPEWDQLDQPEPPPAIGKYISLYFPHDEWQQYPGRYTYDFRSDTEDLQVWNIEVETNINNPTAEINVNGIESVPSEFEVYILDETQRIFQNLRKNPVIKISTVPYPDKKKLILIVGKEDDVQQYNLINDIPDKYEVYQNFPNPFELTTTIPYSIPTDGKVTLRIYNIRGELVTILLDGIQKETGHHLQTWNAQDSFGQTVSSGLYFYQIIIGDFSRTKKMFLKK